MNNSNDIEFCPRRFLSAAPGISKSIKDLFRNASTSMPIMESDTYLPNDMWGRHIVFVVVVFQYIEISLKYIRQHDGSKIAPGHDLFDLFNSLDDCRKNKLKQEYRRNSEKELPLLSENISKYPDDIPQDRIDVMLDNMKACRNINGVFKVMGRKSNFIQWRYWLEKHNEESSMMLAPKDLLVACKVTWECALRLAQKDASRLEEVN